MKFHHPLRAWFTRKPSDRSYARRRRRAGPWTAGIPVVQALESRVLLAVDAQDDWFQTKHDTPALSGAVLTNDYTYGYPAGGPLTASLVSGPSHGTLTFNSNGTFTYRPNPRFVGEDSFIYRASNNSGSDQATVRINIWNIPPQFAAYAEHDSGEWDTSPDDYIFATGEVIAYLDAYSPDGDPLTYSGGSTFLQVLPDGRVQVTDGPGLSNYFDNGGGAIRFPVTVTDGIAIATSQFLLDKKLSWIDQTEIYVQTRNGQTDTPATATALINVLQTIRNNNDTVATLIIKGHGGPDGIQVGDNGEFLTAPNNGNSIYIGNTDVTTLLRDVTDGSTSIYFRGCWTRQLARDVQAKLDGARCYGSVFFVIGIPGTRWTIGRYR